MSAQIVAIDSRKAAAPDKAAWTEKEWVDHLKSKRVRAEQSTAQAVTDLLDEAKAFYEAQTEMRYVRGDSYGQFCERNFGMSPTVSTKWSAIGAKAEILSADKKSLPCALNTLYELSQLIETNRAYYTSAVASGEIHPEMTRAEAIKLRKGTEPAEATDADPVEVEEPEEVEVTPVPKHGKASPSPTGTPQITIDPNIDPADVKPSRATGIGADLVPTDAQKWVNLRTFLYQMRDDSLPSDLADAAAQLRQFNRAQIEDAECFFAKLKTLIPS